VTRAADWPHAHRLHTAARAGEGELKQLLQGKGVSLSSQFRLTYSMILNLLRVEDLKVCVTSFLCDRERPDLCGVG
jgi:hypothetical protein